MKTITFTCVRCGATRTFRGEDADEVAREIDESGWLDTDIQAREAACPDCLADYDAEHEYDGEPD